MSPTSKRLQTLRALTAAAQARSGLPGFNHVDHELQEISTSGRVSPQRRRHLLQVFHGMRALETALKEVADSHGLPRSIGFGGVLEQFGGLAQTHPAHLGNGPKSRFLRTVKPVRDSMMHQANSFPRTAREAEVTMGEIAACFALLVR